MAYVDAKISERDELRAELDDLNNKARALYAQLSEDGEDAVTDVDAALKLQEEGETLTARRNEIDDQLEKLDAEIGAIQELGKIEERAWADAPAYGVPDAPASAPKGGGQAQYLDFADYINEGFRAGEDTLKTLFDRHGSVEVGISGDDVKVIMGGDGAPMSMHAAAQSGLALKPVDADTLAQRAAVGLTQVPQPNLMRYGIRVAMASGYAIDMVPTRSGPNRASSWSEPVYNQSPSAFWRSADYADPTDFSPTAPQRNAAPAEFAVESQVSIQDSMENPNIGDLVRAELNKVFRDKMSPAFIYNDHTANVRTAICNSNLTGNGLIEENAAYWDSTTATDKGTNGEVNAYTAIREAFINLQAQYPGQKTCLIARGLLEQIQEARNSGNLMYPEMREQSRDGVATVSSRGVTYVPIDVGFETMASGKYAWVMTDFGANTELVVVGASVSMLSEIMRRQGKYVLLLDGAAYWRVINRFGVARGKLNQQT